jgi:hypothetical protein
MGRVLTGLLEGLLARVDGIPLRKWIRPVLNCMGGLKGIGFGCFLKPNLAGCPKGVGSGFSLKPKVSGFLKFFRKVQLKNRDRSFEGRELPSMVSSEWVSLVTPESPSSLVPEIRLSMLVSLDDAHPKSFAGDGLDTLSMHAIGLSIGTAVDGSRFGRNALGLGSSSEAMLLSYSMSV